MRADIHGGPEHDTLQYEAGYIDTRPTSDRSTKTSCDARPDHTSGPISDLHSTKAILLACEQMRRRDRRKPRMICWLPIHHPDATPASLGRLSSPTAAGTLLHAPIW